MRCLVTEKQKEAGILNNPPASLPLRQTGQSRLSHTMVVSCTATNLSVYLQRMGGGGLVMALAWGFLGIGMMFVSIHALETKLVFRNSWKSYATTPTC